MRRIRPAGGDAPPDFPNKQRFTEETSDAVRKMNLDLARHNLEVTLKKFIDKCFRGAKELALQGDKEKVRQIDDFIRSICAHEPRKLAEWQELTKRYEFTDDIVE